MTNYIMTDGGRADAGYKGACGDCVVRAISIALKLDYKETYLDLARRQKELTGKRSARNGVHKEVFNKFLKERGWVWHSAPKFNGRKAYHQDMPQGVVIARMAGHIAAVIDGTVYDSFDSTRKMIYGYWATA